MVKRCLIKMGHNGRAKKRFFYAFLANVVGSKPTDLKLKTEI